MRFGGWLIALLGLFIFAYSLVGYDTTVSSGVYERVHNSGLMQTQLILAMFGCSVFVAGVILAAAAGILEHLQARSEGAAD
jgi:hypothetical protein